MSILKFVYTFFLSLRTCIWLFLTLVCLLLYGAFVMPASREFQSIHDVPLLQWMVGNALGVTWWLWASLVIVSLLTVNTIVCSIESLVRKRDVTQWLLLISPQVIHVGVLFIILAHLFSSYGGFKGTAYVYRNSVLALPNGLEVVFDEIHTDISKSGYLIDWSADIRYVQRGAFIARDSIEPNNPSFQNGLGIYIKTVKMSPFPVARIEVSREPGALWALIGSVFFAAGMGTLLMLKIKREGSE